MASKRDAPSEAREHGQEKFYSGSEVVATVPEGPPRSGQERALESRAGSLPAAPSEQPPWLGQVQAGTARAPWMEQGFRHYLRLGLRYKRLILITFCSTMALTVAQLWLRPRVYMAKATILPSAGQNQSGVMGLIASFTGAPPTAVLSEDVSSILFPNIFESRTVGREVLESTYRFQKDGQAVEKTLREELAPESLDKALKLLYRIASFEVNKETGTITVAVTTLYPELSAQIANRFVESLERLCLEMRKTTALGNWTFAQESLDKSLAELTQAEQRLTNFRERNIRMNDPELDLEYMRLQREASLKSQIYVGLSNQLELARIEAAKKLPVVRVLDRADTPNLPVPVPKLTTLVLGVFVGALAAVLSVAAVEVFHYVRREMLLYRSTSAQGSAV
jgi:uncharacterized protein involved in exopolysaccharide biosynthesis